MTKRTHRISKLRIGEISMVDEGDNPGAGVIIMKRRSDLQNDLLEANEAAAHLYELAAGAAGEEGIAKAAHILGEMDMDIEALNARLEKIDADLADVTKRAEDAEAKVATLEADVASRDEQIAKLKAGDTGTDGKGGTDGEDDVLKSLPEPIRKRLLDAEKAAADATAAIEKSRDDAELATNIAKAKELGLADAEGMGGLLHRVAKGKTTAEDAAKVVEVLTIAKNVGEAETKLFKAIGDATGGKGGEDTDAQAQLDAAIDSIQKAKPALTREAAYAEAIEANPALYDEVRKVRPATA